VKSEERPGNLKIEVEKDRRRQDILSSDEVAEQLPRRKDFIFNML
jgi:hypothetical protein